MTIDAVTLPQIEAGATLEEGQQFTIRGSYFDLWPDEICLGFEEELVRNSNTPYHIMEMTEKTANTLVFTVKTTQNYNVPHNWNIFGTPSSPPRSILEYSTI